MTISVRIDAKTEARLRGFLRGHDMPMSQFVREAIEEKLSAEQPRQTPYELGQDVFGRHASGQTDRSQQRKQIINDKIHAKHRR